MKKHKPELLAPVGNVESFYASLNAGADAIFLGLQEFNARGRASNFSKPLLQLAIRKAHEKQVKVYVTLNVLIKNGEIDQLINVLAFLEAVKADGIIIQDWGTYYLAHKYFPKLKLHASTQMANHNSAGVNFNESKGIVRTVLARELTMSELEQICERTKSELEVFIHGALCYSFSGMCLFSSYAGGQGANRGICKQSCRRIYRDGDDPHTLFSLKDNQQILNLQKIIGLGVHSLKIEGRMKSADYVYQVCKAYRLAIDHPENLEMAREMLELDLGREKTAYFLGADVSDGITDDSSIGKRIGTVTGVERNFISFSSTVALKEAYRIRIRNASDDEQLYIKLEDFSEKDQVYRVPTDLAPKIRPGDEVLLVRIKTQSFSSRLGNVSVLPEPKKQLIRKNELKKDLLIGSPQPRQTELFVRIPSPEWLVKLRFDDYEAVILNFSQSDWSRFELNSVANQENKSKIRIEFPRFIAEGKLDFYRELASKFFQAGYQHFFISHLSQKLLIPRGARISTNENVYVLNDAAARMLHNEKITEFTYPLENDYENLVSMANNQGIVPLYFYPELFFSRMPVKISKETKLIADENNKKYRKVVKDGLTVVYPIVPVALFHYRDKLEKKGFRRFLIDYSGEQLSANVVKRILKKYLNGESVQPSGNFNFKLGLK